MGILSRRRRVNFDARLSRECEMNVLGGGVMSLVVGFNFMSDCDFVSNVFVSFFFVRLEFNQHLNCACKGHKQKKQRLHLGKKENSMRRVWDSKNLVSHLSHFFSWRARSSQSSHSELSASKKTSQEAPVTRVFAENVVRDQITFRTTQVEAHAFFKISRNPVGRAPESQQERSN